MTRNVVMLFDNEAGQAMIKDVCKENGMRFSELQELLELEVDQMGRARRAGLWVSFDDILDRIDVSEL